MGLFRRCGKKALNKLHVRETETSTSSIDFRLVQQGVLKLFLQSLSLASLKGLGHLYVVTAAGLRAALIAER